MEPNPLFLRHPELKELMRLILHELQQAQRPANEIILDDNDVMQKLKISKRTLDTFKSERIILYYKFDSKRPRTYYFLSDILKQLMNNRIESISDNMKIK